MDPKKMAQLVALRQMSQSGFHAPNNLPIEMPPPPPEQEYLQPPVAKTPQEIEAGRRIRAMLAGEDPDPNKFDPAFQPIQNAIAKGRAR